MLSTCITTVDIDLDHLTEIIFIRFLYCKVSLPHPHPPYTSLWKEVTMCHPCLRSRNSCVTSLSSDYVCNILEMFPQRRNLSFYSIYLFISIQTRGYSFLVWHINQYYFISCLNCSSFDPCEFFQGEYSSFEHCKFLSFWYATTLLGQRCSKFILCIPSQS